MTYVAEIVKFTWTVKMMVTSRRRWIKAVCDAYPRLRVGAKNGRQMFDAFADVWTLKVRADNQES